MSKLIRSKRALDEAVIALFDHAPYLYPLYALTGPLPLRHHKPGFAGLARLIVSQQVSTASARAIWGRVLAAFPALDPDAILAATDTDLRACGLSAPKIRTLRAIATAVATGTLPLARLGRMPADKAHALMVAVKGIGPWTADLYLLFCIGHADAFPSGDLALQEGLRMAYELEERPNALELEAYAEDWRPYRGIVAQLLWAYYGVMKQRQGVPD
jgi:DNA-3-methyladenine glycosylase II